MTLRCCPGIRPYFYHLHLVSFLLAKAKHSVSLFTVLFLCLCVLVFVFFPIVNIVHGPELWSAVDSFCEADNAFVYHMYTMSIYAEVDNNYI